MSLCNGSINSTTRLIKAVIGMLATAAETYNAPLSHVSPYPFYTYYNPNSFGMCFTYSVLQLRVLWYYRTYNLCRCGNTIYIAE